MENFDPNAIEVVLSSVGKLSFPPRIKVRDYSLDDALLLANSSEQTFFKNLVAVVNNILLVENHTANELHEKEMEEILLTVFATFWQKTMEFPYTPDKEELALLDDGTRKAIHKGEFSPKFEIDLSTLTSIPLIEKFKEPIVLTHQDHSYIFRLPRIGDYILAEEAALNEFAFQEKDFQEIENTVSYNEDRKEAGELEKMKFINPETFKKYKEFLIKKSNFYTKAQQYLSLEGIDGNRFDSLEQKMKQQVPLGLWNKLKNVIEKNCQFGVNPKVVIKSPLTAKEREISLPFRYLDLIPTRDNADHSEVDFQFGL